MIFLKRKNNVSIFTGLFLSALVIVFLTSTDAFSQQPDAALEKRVEALENYVATIQPTFVEMSDHFNTSIQQYTQGLESSLENYSRTLQRNLDQRLDGLGGKTVMLNPFSKEYQSIETNTGTFLIAVERLEQIDNGVRLHINVGNPNFADYNDFQLRFIWGRKYGGGQGVSYEEWRQTLNGVEVTFNGKLEKGKWNSIAVDLSPVGQGDLSYLECEMSVTSVELGMDPVTR